MSDISLYAGFFLGMCAFAFTKKLFAVCRTFYLFMKVVFSLACFKVDINTDVFMRDNPTPVNSESLRSLFWASMIVFNIMQ